jgi:UDP-glucose:(heptosyl)LPS alpha-1,3-glucosyltransferase
VPEALHAGLPVITSGNNGAAELIDEGATGYVVADPFDRAAWADRMARLIDDPALRSRMSAEARRQSLQMTMDVRIKELSAVLNRLAVARRASAATSRRAA